MTTFRRRISFLIEGFSKSGGIRVIVDIANCFSEAGFDVHIFAPDYSPDCPFPLLPKVEVHLVETKGKGVWRKVYYLWAAGSDCIRNADLVYATSYKTPFSILFGRIATGSHAKVVSFIQGVEGESIAAFSSLSSAFRIPMKLVATISPRLISTRVVVSHWIASRLKINAKVIPNGIDEAIFKRARFLRDTSVETIRIGCFYSHSPSKGFKLFEQAMLLFQQRSAKKIVINLASTVTPLTALQHNYFDGSSDQEVAAFYASCDIFVFPSYNEGFGLPPLEAMASGTAVVATKCGGVGEYASIENGLWIDTGSPEQIANALVALCSDSKLQAKLVAGGLATARLFKKEHMQQQHLAFAHLLLAQDRVT